MIPHTQTIPYPSEDTGPGDCWRTCIASVLDIQDPLGVPHFADEITWWEDTLNWLDNQGLQMHYATYASSSIVEAIVWFGRTRPGYWIMGGESPRNSEWAHVVIMRGNKMVHDPHPERTGLAGPLTDDNTWDAVTFNWRPNA